MRAAVSAATGLTPAGLVLAGVAASAWTLAYVVAGRPLYVLAYCCAGVLALSWLIARRPLPLVGVRSTARPRLREGETLEMEITLTATRRLSTFILEERVPPALGRNARLPVAELERDGMVTERYSLDCWRRGVYELGPMVARWGDPFGLTERELVLAEPFELLVHPAVEEVHDRALTRLWEDPPVRPPVSKPWPTGLEFYGMRSYEPGDDIRKIVWRVFGRTGQVMVREAEQGITDRVVLVLDQNAGAHSRDGAVSDSFEAAVRVAGSLGVQHLKEGYSVALEGTARTLAGPLRGGNSRIVLLDALARVTTNREPLSAALSRVVADPRRDAHVAVVASDLDDDSLGRIRLLLDRGVHVLVAAVIWDELATANLARATSMGASVVELRPGTPMSLAFRREVGAGRR